MIGYKTPNIIDNAIHITYSFADANGVVTTPSDDLKTAVQNALSEWSTTGVPENWVFDPAPPGYDGDIQILPSSDNQKSGGCAGYSEAVGRLYYSPAFTSAVTSVKTQVLAHEIGHLWGMQDAGTSPPTPTIMNNPSNVSCTSPNAPTTTVLSTDRHVAAGCIKQARSQSNSQYSSGTNFHYYGTCYDIYETYMLYSWNSEIEAWRELGRNSILVGTTCPY